MREKVSDKKTRPAFSVTTGAVCFVLLVLADRLTKVLAVARLKGNEPVNIIGEAFQLYYLENHGAAFGILQGRRIAFIFITVAVLAVIAYFYARMPFRPKYRLLRILMVFIAAGAVGNFIDRVRQGYVVDFFYIKLINFPIFNVADIYVTVCIIVLVLYLLFRVKDDDMSELAESLRLRRKK